MGIYRINGDHAVRRLNSRRVVAEADTSWWLSGGISAANCVAAYQPKGAADYATSKVNLANPGTNNAAETANPVAWDATNGWKFDGSSNILTTGITPSAGYSMIIRYSNNPMAQKDACGTSDTASGKYFTLRPYHFASARLYAYGSSSQTPAGSTSQTSGVMALVGNVAGYFNGSQECTLVSSYSATSAIFIGRGYNTWWGGYAQAFAIYSGTITPTQVSLLTTAMAAL